MSKRKPITSNGVKTVPKQEPVVEQPNPPLSETTEQTVAPITVADAVDTVAEQPTTEAEQVEETAAETEQPVVEQPAPPAPPVLSESIPDAVQSAPVSVAAVEDPDTIYTFLKKKYSGVAAIPTTVLGIIDKLDKYVAAMGVNVPVTEEEGTKHQLALHRLYTTALDIPNGGHVLALDVILWYVTKHRDSAFSDRLAARFLNTNSFPPERQRAFVSLTNLFTMLSNPATRRNLNQHVNMDVVVRNIPSLTHRRNLLSYVSK